MKIAAILLAALAIGAESLKAGDWISEIIARNAQQEQENRIRALEQQFEQARREQEERLFQIEQQQRQQQQAEWDRQSWLFNH
jgi:hypothetical protein